MQFHLKSLIDDSYTEKLMRNNPAKTVTSAILKSNLNLKISFYQFSQFSKYLPVLSTRSQPSDITKMLRRSLGILSKFLF